MEIQLKTIFCWLINEIPLEKRLKSGTRRGLAIFITVENSTKVSTLCAKSLRFEGVLKMVGKIERSDQA